MTKALKAIPTTYHGIEFRSKLEAKYAKAFDRLGIVWEYEGRGFQFDDGTFYCPDFYMPEIGTYFEVKGVMDEASRHKADLLAAEADRVIIGYPDGRLSASIRDVEADWSESFNWEHRPFDGFVTGCVRCGKKWFANISGSYRCPYCGAWDGDHYLLGYSENVFEAAGWSND